MDVAGEEVHRGERGSGRNDRRCPLTLGVVLETVRPLHVRREGRDHSNDVSTECQLASGIEAECSRDVTAREFDRRHVCALELVLDEVLEVDVARRTLPIFRVCDDGDDERDTTLEDAGHPDFDARESVATIAKSTTVKKWLGAIEERASNSAGADREREHGARDAAQQSGGAWD